MNTLVFIPAYKPDERLCEICSKLSSDYELLVVDDGSGSSFDSVFEKTSEFATVLRYEKNRGKGGALKYGFSEIEKLFPDVKYVVTADADGQHTPSDIAKVASAVSEKGGLVLGSREFTGKVPLRSSFGNAVTRVAFALSTGKRVRDTQTGLRAFSVEYLDEFSALNGDRYEYEMTMLMHAAESKIRITEVGIETIYENNNETSHFSPVRDSLRIYKIIFNNSTIFKCIVASVLSFLLEILILNLLKAFVFTGTSAVPAKFIGTPIEQFWDISFVISWVASSFFNYNINRFWVFKSDIKYAKGMAEYYSLAIVSFFIKFLIYGGLKIALTFIPGDNLRSTVSDIIASTAMYIINYIVQKKFIFRKKTK